jgi:hypothetical protein
MLKEKLENRSRLETAGHVFVTKAPDHLIQLPGTQWSLWRCVCLRSAGFPAAQVLELSTHKGAAAADQIFEIENRLERRRDEALNAVNEALDELRRNQEWENKAKRKPLLNALSSLKRNEPTKPVNDAKAQTILELFCQDTQDLQAAHKAYKQAFESATSQLTKSIHNVASTERFREAVTWQNRRALHTGINHFLQEPLQSPRNSRRRQHEQLIASYVQRYCVKNDTIGFFGPVGWAEFVSQGEPLVARPGSRLLATRNVYFEEWCITALAETLAKNEALLPWIAPRRLPHVYVKDTTLYLPLVRPCRISPAEAAILQACDGERTAKELAAELIQNPSLGLKQEEEVFAILKRLRQTRRITWALEIPLDLYPERSLRRMLERIEDQALRQPALKVLDELEAARPPIGDAAGDADQLDQALDALEKTFTHLTGTPSTRRAGEMYAARTLVYEDCRRDVKVEIGPQLLQDLAPPLALILTGARWYTFETAAIYRQILGEIFARLVQKFGSPVRLTDFWLWSHNRFYDGDALPTGPLLSTFQERWAQVLSLSPEQRRIEWSSQELLPRVSAAFDAPRPGWNLARHHSPDVMIAANSPEAIRRGDYQFVLGEIHLSVNALSSLLFLAQHPSQEELFSAYESDMPGPSVLVVPTTGWTFTARTRPTLASPNDLHLEISQDKCSIYRGKIGQIGMFVVEESDDGLVVRTRDGRLCFDIVEFFGYPMTATIIDDFQILSASNHTPRVTVDRLVIRRESWRFPVADIPFAFEKSKATRFLAARRWAHNHNIPRFVFIRVPIEPKPLYVDFDSPVYVEILAKAIRRTRENDKTNSTLTVTEMLPTPDQVWLPDAQGRRYTSEFRIVAFDSLASL